MFVYHEADPSSAESILETGLKRTSRGAKGDDSAIARTDQLLDEHMPSELKDNNVSRDDNLYAYIADGDKIVDITDGQLVELSDFISRSKQAIFRLTVTPERCYVSDLDLYDRIKEAVENKTADDQVRNLVHNYWQALIQLDAFAIGEIKRPEVMVTYDIDLKDIQLISGGQ